MAPSRGIRLAEPVEQHPDRDLVGHELAALHVAAGLEADRRAFLDGRPEQVAGGDVGHAQPFGEDRGLGALAGARGTRAGRRHVTG